MFCLHCGTAVNERARFCANCGKECLPPLHTPPEAAPDVSPEAPAGPSNGLSSLGRTLGDPNNGRVIAVVLGLCSLTFVLVAVYVGALVMAGVSGRSGGTSPAATSPGSSSDKSLTAEPGTATAAAPHARPLSLDDEALQEAEKHFDKLMTRCGEDTYVWRTGQGVYIYHQAEGRRIIVRSQPVRALTEADRRNGVPERQWKGQAEVWFATGRNFLPSSNRLSRWKDKYTYERTAILEKNGGEWTIADAMTSVEAPIKCSDFPSS